MAAPPSKLELLNLKKSSEMATVKAIELEFKKKQLLAANKQKARILLLGISTNSYTTVSKRDNWPAK